MNILDLFSGAGGFSKGFEKEGFNIIAANEINTQIAETYKYNHKNTRMFNLDIKEFSENLEEYLKNIIPENNYKNINIKIKKTLYLCLAYLNIIWMIHCDNEKML